MPAQQPDMGLRTICQRISSWRRPNRTLLIAARPCKSANVDSAVYSAERTYLESVLIIIRRLQIRRRREWSIRIRCWLGIWLDLGCHFDVIDLIKAVF
jgi:hypothetical protein